jgi:FkbM family methyltransferase
LWKFNYLLFSLALRGMGIKNVAAISYSGEKWMIRNVLKKLGKDLIVFDVGANVGKYTQALIANRLDIEKVYAFEPNQRTFAALTRNVEGHKQVVLINSGVSDTVGQMALYDKSGDNGNGSHASLSKDIFSDVYHSETTQSMVAITTVDVFCKEHGINRIDFMKIDVEGYELHVLLGAKQMLQEKRIRAIQFEFTHLNSTIGLFFKQLYDVLCENYVIYRILPHGLHSISSYHPTSCEVFGFQNYVALLKSEHLLN